MDRRNGIATLPLLIVTLAVIAAVGGYLVFTPETQEPQEEMPTPIAPSDETTDWQTYRNEQLGVEFKYPSHFSLNTQPTGLWKDAFGAYTYRFFELVDSGRGCYVGPLIERGLGSEYREARKNIETADRQSLEIKYLSRSENDLKFGLVFIPVPRENYTISMHLVGLANDLIVSESRNLSSEQLINAGCVQDFEQILSTFKLVSSAADISTWQTYRNEQYGFEVKYPPSWTARMNPTLTAEVIIKDPTIRDGITFAVTEGRPLIGNADIGSGVPSLFKIAGVPATEIYADVGESCDGGGCLDIPMRLLWVSRGQSFYTAKFFGTSGAAIEGMYKDVLSTFKFICSNGATNYPHCNADLPFSN